MSEIKPPSAIDATTSHANTTTKPARPSKRKRKAARPAPPLAPPWIEGGIDYDPALVAIEELIDWAFGVAAASVADAPADVRRVRNARRYALAAIHGKADPRSVDDVVFAAGLLARVLDADLGLGLGDIVTVLEQMGLPADDVPSPPRRPPGRRQPRAASAGVDRSDRGARRGRGDPVARARRAAASARRPRVRAAGRDLRGVPRARLPRRRVGGPPLHPNRTPTGGTVMAKHKPKKHKHRNSAGAAPAPRRRASIRRGDPPDPWTIVAAAAGGAGSALLSGLAVNQQIVSPEGAALLMIGAGGATAYLADGNARIVGHSMASAGAGQLALAMMGRRAMTKGAAPAPAPAPASSPALPAGAPRLANAPHGGGHVIDVFRDAAQQLELIDEDEARMGMRDAAPEFYDLADQAA
jgi:hypothetical protein